MHFRNSSLYRIYYLIYAEWKPSYLWEYSWRIEHSWIIQLQNIVDGVYLTRNSDDCCNSQSRDDSIRSHQSKNSDMRFFISFSSLIIFYYRLIMHIIDNKAVKQSVDRLNAISDEDDHLLTSKAYSLIASSLECLLLLSNSHSYDIVPE